LWWFIKDWWPIVVLPVIAFTIAYASWRRWGVDEGAGTQAVAVEFEPPKDLSPSEVGTLIDESCDTPDIIATLIDLAARGWMTIREMPAEKILFLSNRDYQFIRTAPPVGTPPLKDHEQQFLDGLFSSGNNETRLSYQKEKFYRYIEPVKRAIYRSLMSMGVFKSDPRAVRSGWAAIGILIAIAGVALCVIWSSFISLGLGAIIAGVIFLCFAPAMPALTALGTRKLIECLSFKRFVSMVERDRIKQMAMNDPTIFGRLLPYAMVLGVADQWAQAFAGLMIQPPDWYVPYDNRPFNSMWFIHDLGSGMRVMQRTMTSIPQPKTSSSHGAGGGFSGFSGGFSGGGFGGGGGSSW
jgi:uncharacterized membrane protein